MELKEVPQPSTMEELNSKINDLTAKINALADRITYIENSPTIYARAFKEAMTDHPVISEFRAFMGKWGKHG